MNNFITCLFRFFFQIFLYALLYMGRFLKGPLAFQD